MLLDMDGTLTRPNLDFAAIRRELGLPPDMPILEEIDRRPPAEAAALHERLHALEAEAAAATELDPAAVPLFDVLQNHGLPTAVVTRNTRASLDLIWQMFDLPPCLQLTREWLPHKPAPDPLLHVCGKLGVDPTNSWMVGDGEHDIDAGHAAGCMTIWIRHGEVACEAAATPDVTVASLADVVRLIDAATSPPLPSPLRSGRGG